MNAPASSEMKTLGCSIVPLLNVPKDAVQTYFQTLAVYDTLKYRFPDLYNPMWLDVVEVIQRMGSHMYLVQEPDGEIITEFMLDNSTGQSVQSHFSTHPLLSTNKRIEVGRYCVDQVLTKWIDPKTRKPFLKSLFGLTPLPNRAACIFAMKIGYKKLGILPGGVSYLGKTVDAMISVASKEE